MDGSLFSRPLDAWSRRVVSWPAAWHFRTQLVLDALNMAIGQRRPIQVVHHSDRGCQYTSAAFGLRCQEVSIRSALDDESPVSHERQHRPAA